MSNQHSVIEHRANYFFLKIEEDYIAIFPEKDKTRHCKAAILSILEHWMNSKRTETSQDNDLYVYLSYPQFAKQMFELFGRSTVIKCMKDLVIDGLVLSHPYVDSFNQKTFAYMLNIDVINARLRSLPERKGSVKMNGGSVKINYPHSKVNGGSSKNTLPSSKSERNIDYIDNNIDSTQTDKEESTIVNSANAEVDAPAAITDLQEWKKITDKHKAINLKGHANNGNHHHSSNSDLRRSGDGIPDSIGDGSEERRRDGLAADIRGHATPAQAATEGQLAQQTTSSSDSGTTPVQRSEVLPPGIPASLGAAQVGGKKRPKKPVEPIILKSDTREVQRRINEHRGYALEDKGLIINECTSIKTWCSLHTIEEFGLVMAGAKKDKYWGKQENYYRIGGAILLKITPEILARQRAPLQMAANGNGHTPPANAEGLITNGDFVWWDNQWMTEDQANETGFNGGFGLYK